MSDPLSRLRRFLRELKRRKVYRVAATYAVVVFVTLQAAQLIFPATTLEGLYDKLVVLAFVGFPIAVVLAWAFEVTPEGVRRTAEAKEEPAGDPTAYPWIGLAAVVLLAGGVWYVTAGGEKQPPAETAAATDTAQAESTVSDRSVAVLPFDNLSGTEEAEPFVNGLHDDLLTRLSNISDLKVISRTSVLAYRETKLSLPAIADSLGVIWIVEGGVQQAGDQVQVNAQLIQAEEDAHQWAETYRRELTTENLFAVQSELTKKIAQSLEAELDTSEERRVEREPTQDLDAYKLYARGRRQLARRSVESIREARSFFERALQRDSTFAPAWAGLADARVLLVAYSRPEMGGDGSASSSGSYDAEMRDALPPAKAAARRAVELDPELAEAHAALGAVYFYEQVAKSGQGNGPAALREFLRAAELKPSFAHAHQWLGDLYQVLGHPESARKHASLAVELDPRHAAGRQVLAMVLLGLGDVEGAEKHLLQEHPHDPPPVQKGVLLYHLERWTELQRLAQTQLDRFGTPQARFYLARIALLRGDTAGAKEQLTERLRREAPLAAGLIHAAVGEVDAAFDAWQRIDNWGRQPLSLRYYFPDVLGPLRNDPRYQELIQTANVAWGLNPDGSLPDSVDVSFDAQSDE